MTLKPLPPDVLATLATPAETVAEQRLSDTRKAVAARKQRAYDSFCKKAAEADFALDKCAELAGVSWPTVVGWLSDRKFVDQWAQTRIALNEKMFGTSVGLALGREVAVQTEDGDVRVEARPPDGAMLRHLQTALDPRFAKRATIEHTGSVDVNVRSALTTMTDAEKRDELRRLLADEPLEIEVASE